jgi:3-deoxy-D-manno-octulosonic-acid transferase
MKFDTASVADRVAGDEELAGALRLNPEALSTGRAGAAERIWVCGSTGPGEEELILRQFRALLAKHARLRLIIVPRKPERFEEVAELITAAGFSLLRRSHTLRSAVAQPGSETILPPVILGDTMGELRKFYSLADVVFVGRTLVDLGPRQHGSDMIEPAALAKPVVVGPFTGNFADAMSRFKAGDAVMEVQTAEQLGEAISVLLSSPQQAKEMGKKAQRVVINEKGATERHALVLLT